MNVRLKNGVSPDAEQAGDDRKRGTIHLYRARDSYDFVRLYFRKTVLNTLLITILCYYDKYQYRKYQTGTIGTEKISRNEWQ